MAAHCPGVPRVNTQPAHRMPKRAVLRGLLVLGLVTGLGARAAAPKPDSAKTGPRTGATIQAPIVFGFRAPISEANRTVAQVSGKEARPSLLAGQVQITEFRLETYRYAPDKQTEIIVESPLGVFGGNGADSDRAIVLRSADDRFSITGEGWGWNRNSGLLVISNKVLTTLRRPGAPTNRAPVEVRSRRFEYNLKNGEARFIDDCEATEAGQARIKAGELASRLSARAEKPDSIRATNGVVIELLRPGRPGRATGSGAVFSQTPAGDRIELSGPTTWQFSAGEGSADELVLLPAKDSYAARGNARLVLVRAAASRNPAAGAADGPGSPLEILSAFIEGTPREVVFGGPVKAVQGKRLSLEAGHVVAAFEPAPANTAKGGEPETPRPTRITATEGVKARILAAGSPVDLRGGRMEYTVGEHEIIEVLEKPAWDSAAHAGRASRFIIHPEVPSFQAIDEVHVVWRSGGGGSSTELSPIEVAAGRLLVEPSEARFTGGVTAVRKTWKLQCADLDLGLSTNSAPKGFAGRGGVVLEYDMPAPAMVAATAVGADPQAGAGTGQPRGGFARPATAEARRWILHADEAKGEFAVGSTNSIPRSLDAVGKVRIDNVALTASGGRLSYRDSDGLMRLTEDARLRTVTGLRIVGEPGTALALDPVAGRFSVEKRWSQVRLPMSAFRAAGSTNAPARR